MIALPLGATRVDEALRVVRALGAHRYVAGRLHLIHALAIAPLDATRDGISDETCAWAKDLLGGGSIDPRSRDERLWRRVSDAELVAVLAGYWTPVSHARDALRALLLEYDLPIPDHAPFDENVENDVYPLAVDAGWELLSLAELDPERHRGAVLAFGDDMAFAAARFDEESALPPAASPIYELPALGPVELLRGAQPSGDLVEPLVLWVQGNPTYIDYVIRGVRRAAKTHEE